MQVSPDVITWRIVASALSVTCITLVGIVGKIYIDRMTSMEVKINGIIKFLITTASNGERTDLAKLIGEE